MSYRLLELPNALITDLSFNNNKCTLTFLDVLIIKVMDAAQQRTSWKQSGCIVVKGNFDDSVRNLQMELPAKVQSGKFQDNIFVYDDTIRLPCHVYGDVGIDINFEEPIHALEIRGEEMEVVLEGTPKYIAHID